MILKQGEGVDSVVQKMNDLGHTILHFVGLQCSYEGSKFKLDVRDCFLALYRSKAMHWVDFGPDGFDAEEYDQLDNPLNADMHEIVPGKLLVMRGPKDLPSDASWSDVYGANGSFRREFSPQHYAEILRQFGVQVVVRCNAPQYDKRGFEDAGIAVVDLQFEGGGVPPVDVVAKFLAVAEAVPGAVAVHCRSGLGRAATLAGLYLMKHHGFTAREAIGWLRIVRPGRWASLHSPPHTNVNHSFVSVAARLDPLPTPSFRFGRK